MFGNLSRRTLSVFAGSIWLLAGANLLFLGAKFLLQSVELAHSAYLPFLHTLMGLLPNDVAMPVLAVCGLLVGVLKGMTVIRKAARREVERIANLPQPISITQLYSRRGAILLGLMFCLGFSLRFLSVPLDIRGFIDVAVGAALIMGSASYLRVEESAVQA